MRNVFKELQHEPPARLLSAVVLRVAVAEARQTQVRRAVFGSIAAVFAIVAFVSFGYAVRELAQSEFLQYFSLLFSDGQTLLVVWREFALSLAESVPLTGVTLVLVTSLISLGSLKAAVRQVHTVQYIPVY